MIGGDLRRLVGQLPACLAKAFAGLQQPPRRQGCLRVLNRRSISNGGRALPAADQIEPHRGEADGDLILNSAGSYHVLFEGYGTEAEGATVTSGGTYTGPDPGRFADIYTINSADGLVHEVFAVNNFATVNDFMFV